MKKNGKNKFIIFTLFLCIMTSFIMIGTSANKAPIKKNYLALGDSITTGYGLDDKADSYTNIIARDENINLVNMAQDGDTSGMLLKKLENKDVIKEVKKADLITITIGGNDFMDAFYLFVTEKFSDITGDSKISFDEMKSKFENGDSGILLYAATVVAEFAESKQASDVLSSFTINFQNIIKTIRNYNKDACVIIATQYNPYSYLAQKYGGIFSLAENISDMFDVSIAKLNDVIKKNAGNCIVAEIYDTFETSVAAGINPCNPYVESVIPFKVELDFHPNAEGHSLIASCIRELIVYPVRASVDESGSRDMKNDEKIATWFGILVTFPAITVILLKNMKNKER